LFAESDPGYDTDESIPRAEHALDEVVRRGLFLVEGNDEFELVTYASTTAELRDYWATYGAFDDTPKDEAVTAQDEALYAKANEIAECPERDHQSRKGTHHATEPERLPKSETSEVWGGLRP
jgi:hypothetical protein